jgi:hypothetical protein
MIRNLQKKPPNTILPGPINISDGFLRGLDGTKTFVSEKVMLQFA